MSRDLVADAKHQQTQRGFSYDLYSQPFGYIIKAISILIHLRLIAFTRSQADIINNNKLEAYTKMIVDFFAQDCSFH